MIRHVLYVDLPGIIFALDRRARSLGRSLATFVCAPEYEETHSGLSAVLANLLPVRAMARTWIFEERWRMLGVAQARMRPLAGSWEVTYLASLVNQSEASQEILRNLIEFATNDAIRAGMQRIFARIEESEDHQGIFQRVGYQRYARELLYVRASPIISHAGEPEKPLPMGSTPLRPRRWHRNDAWGLVRLHDVTTPRKVQFAENLSSDELVHQFLPIVRQWYIPGIEPRDESYVLDLESRLGAWVRLRQGWAGLPHQIWLKVHPEHADLAPAFIQFALHRLCQGGGVHMRTPVICHLREYEGASIDALRHEGFEHTGTRAILVRHLTLSAFHERAIQGLPEARINYGVKGLGTLRSPVLPSMREEDICSTPRSPMTSTSCSPRSRRASRRLSTDIPDAAISSKSLWTWDDSPRPASLAKR